MRTNRRPWSLLLPGERDSPAPWRVRRSLHAVHALIGIALIASGALILHPDLRTSTVGGYGREIGLLHVYGGLAFAGAPLLAWWLAPRGLLKGAWERVHGHAAGTIWRRAHIVVSLAASALLVVTGLVLWLGDELPIVVWDAADAGHVVGHWVVMLSLPVHLVASRRRIAERLRLLLGGEPPPLFEFDDEPDEPH